jgi:hypothetical protein
MAKRPTKATQRGKRVKSLPVKSTSSRKAGSVTGGKGGAFEIKDWSFGVENPTTIGSATGGAGAGKIKFGEINIKKP